jgi:hypothetical protein
MTTGAVLMPLLVVLRRSFNIWLIKNVGIVTTINKEVITIAVGVDITYARGLFVMFEKL